MPSQQNSGSCLMRILPSWHPARTRPATTSCSWTQFQRAWNVHSATWLFALPSRLVAIYVHIAHHVLHWVFGSSSSEIEPFKHRSHWFIDSLSHTFESTPPLIRTPLIRILIVPLSNSNRLLTQNSIIYKITSLIRTLPNSNKVLGRIRIRMRVGHNMTSGQGLLY